jgi:hypothetical protein
VNVIPRPKVAKADIGMLVYQGDSHPESYYAPSLLSKFMLLLQSAKLRDKKKNASTRTELARLLAPAYGKHKSTVYYIYRIV